MISDLYVIQDVKVGEYKPPFIQRNVKEALRTVDHLLKSPDQMFSKYPEDFHLVRVGTFNHDTGVIISCDPTLVARFVDMVNQQ